VQKQDLSQSPVFKLPITLEFVNGDKHSRTDVWLLTADSTFEFEVNGAPSYVVFDPDDVLLCQKRGIFGVGPNAWKAQLGEGQSYSQLEQAVEHYKLGFDDIEENEDFLAFMNSKDWATRMLILTDLYELGDGPVPVIAELALKLLDDPKSAVRVAAVDFFSERQGTLHYPENDGLRLRAVAALEEKIADSSYIVSRSALDALYQLDSLKGRALAEQLSKSNEKHLYVTIARILRSAGSPMAMPFVEGLLQDPSIPAGLKSGLLRGFGQWLAQSSAADIVHGQSLLMDIAAHESDRWLRFFSIQALLELPTNADLQKQVQALAAKEKDEVLLSAMQRYIKTN
jgi:aminopeptidase N